MTTTLHYENILVPIDKSEHSKHALEAAKEFALANENAKLSIITVVFEDVDAEEFEFATEEGLGPIATDYETDKMLLENTEETAAAHIRKAGAKYLQGIDDSRITYEVVVYPSAAEGIVDYCEDHSCDLIIMGRRGASGLKSLLGNVAKGVLKKAECPVLTIK